MEKKKTKPHASKKSVLQSYRLRIIPIDTFQTADLLLKGLEFF